MLRLLAVIAAFGALGMAFALYGVKYDTRRLEARVQVDERTVERLQGDIAVLKAERAYLARPERIEKLARKQGLGEIRESQYVQIESLGPIAGASAAALGANAR
ncbi:MAG TPA: cell division protein FtsL [Hyphomicrobiaceae bacterium]|nr:cell division protein FtsL [Hyphomicrobiaceae bacterium]